MHTNPFELTISLSNVTGGGSVLGHPIVYLNLGLHGKIVCPYCSQEFVNPLWCHSERVSGSFNNELLKIKDF